MWCSCSCLCFCLSIYLFIYLSSCLSIYLSIYLQVWKRSYSARLPQFLNLTTSKTQQFCETSSTLELDNVKNEAIVRDFFKCFQVDNIQNETILRDVLQKCKVECKADGLVPMRFAIFPLHLSKLLRLPRKSDARSYEVLHLSRKIILANPKISCSKMQPLSGNLRPDLLTHLTHVSLVLRLPREMHLCRNSSNVPRLPSFLKLLQNPHIWLTFGKVRNPLPLPRETTSGRAKVLRTPQGVALLTSKCAAHHNGVHFVSISTSKSRLNMRCFVHFDFRVCFAPQLCALFRHLYFQKWSEHGVSCTFWLPTNVLRATAACNFSSLIWPDGSAPAALASLLFDPRSQKSLEKHSVSRLSYLFAQLHLRSSDSFSSLILSLLLFSSLTLPTSAFPSVHIVGSLTSKLPLPLYSSQFQYFRWTMAINCSISVEMGRWQQNYGNKCHIIVYEPRTLFGNAIDEMFLPHSPDP